VGNFSSATIRLEFVCMLVYVMPGVHCAAVGCNNYKFRSKLSFHRFPKDVRRLVTKV